LAGRLVEDGALRRGITVTVDGVVSRRGLRTPVRENSEVHFLPPVGGGRD
jgi:molybdopterin converting factor small subunit